MRTACIAGRPASFLATDAGWVVMAFVGEDQAKPDFRKKLKELKLPPARTGHMDSGRSS